MEPLVGACQQPPTYANASSGGPYVTWCDDSYFTQRLLEA